MPEYVRQAGSRRLKKFSYRAVSANKQHDNGKDTHNRTASLITVALQQISSIIGHCGFFGGFENVMQVSQEDRDAFSGTPFCQFTQTKVGVSSKRFTLEAVAKRKAKTATKVMRLLQKPAPSLRIFTVYFQ